MVECLVVHPIDDDHVHNKGKAGAQHQATPGKHKEAVQRMSGPFQY